MSIITDCTVIITLLIGNSLKSHKKKVKYCENRGGLKCILWKVSCLGNGAYYGM